MSRAPATPRCPQRMGGAEDHRAAPSRPHPSPCAPHQPFGMPRELVAEDGHSVDLPTAVEVRLQLFRRAPVIHLQQQSWCLHTTSQPHLALSLQVCIHTPSREAEGPADPTHTLPPQFHHHAPAWKPKPKRKLPPLRGGETPHDPQLPAGYFGELTLATDYLQVAEDHRQMLSCIPSLGWGEAFGMGAASLQCKGWMGPCTRDPRHVSS